MEILSDTATKEVRIIDKSIITPGKMGKPSILFGVHRGGNCQIVRDQWKVSSNYSDVKTITKLQVLSDIRVIVFKDIKNCLFVLEKPAVKMCSYKVSGKCCSQSEMEDWTECPCPTRISYGWVHQKNEWLEEKGIRRISDLPIQRYYRTGNCMFAIPPQVRRIIWVKDQFCCYAFEE